MNLATRALMGAGAAGLVFLLAALQGVWTPMSEVMIAAMVLIAGVAFAAQWARFRRDEQRVYRPVYVRSTTVHRRVRNDER